MGRNDEAFCLLAEEIARTRTLLDNINSTRLMRLTNDLESQISGNTDRNKNNEPLLLQALRSF